MTRQEVGSVSQDGSRIRLAGVDENGKAVVLLLDPFDALDQADYLAELAYRMIADPKTDTVDSREHRDNSECDRPAEHSS